MRAAGMVVFGILLSSLAPGTASAFISTTLHFSPYVPGSMPAVEASLARIGDKLQVTGHVELSACPIEIGKNFPKVAIYTIESGDTFA